MKTEHEAERLRRVMADPLGAKAETSAMARSAFQSRTQFHRLFRTLFAETPAAMGRRLLLELAAWRFGRSRDPITEIALDAQ